ncbi:MAG: biosynthetic-type acetolactate synthase large subunit [Candidatus Bathyarchaeota archaeon]|uniref:biosynthetic-type acetolactate synthase large subunit n=1 Tax=Candidatus Bathycorpusculum sp. TaxID=2994959 RepID=UPI0028333188|nr:biosynthetic-type acetolactate synthase large subunit [Candidatus Termiticorpusculum sp.]MCL2257496.1 biosynthetic-type acetolactate synthase large subunit [Candidatus Termiticorpusculum sp.]MCL2292369.1 biosynthetic-type acetolactate synthase large subunit [Candidatus Termiticorpusculum sp.]
MPKMSGAQALLESLERQNVDTIFGILGGAILPVYDALYDNKKIRHILARHEQCAAHEAEGYARASGRVGVCMATSGPGATNLVTGIANAYMDSSPIIALTGQIPTCGVNSSYMIGRDAFQEADILGITTAITKYNYQPQTVLEIPQMVTNAFHIATTGRPGPVLIDLPKNVQTNIAEVEFTDKHNIRSYRLPQPPDLTKISQAAELLATAERPMLLVGGGVILADASNEIVKMSDLLMAPVATTFMGKGAFPESHPLSLGCIGMHGNPAANRIIGEADVLLAIGTRLSDRATTNLDTFAEGAKKIQIDIDAAEINKNVEVDLAIISDAKVSMEMLLTAISEKLKKGKGKAWTTRVKEVKEQLSPMLKEAPRGMTPKALLSELRKLLPASGIITTEVGQNQMWSALYMQSLQPRTFISSGGLGTMGFGFPAAIGAKVARPDSIVVDIAGDGSFIMSEQELACSVTEDIPVIVMVLNNSVLGMVAQWQRTLYSRRYKAINLGKSPDFVKLAEAYGAQGIRVASIDEFKKAIKTAMTSKVTTVIDVPIGSETDVVPFVPPGCGLPEQRGDY